MSTVEVPGVIRAAAKDVWYWLVLRGVLVIAFGVVAFVWPSITLVALVFVFGFYAVIDGLAAIVEGVKGRAAISNPLSIALGTLSVAIGVVALFLPKGTLQVFIVLLGVWAIAAGVIQVALAFEARRIPGTSWGVALAAGVLTLIFGVVAIASWVTTAVALAVIIGVWAVLYGVALVILGFKVRSFSKGGPTIIEIDG